MIDVAPDGAQIVGGHGWLYKDTAPTALRLAAECEPYLMRFYIRVHSCPSVVKESLGKFFYPGIRWNMLDYAGISWNTLDARLRIPANTLE